MGGGASSNLAFFIFLLVTLILLHAESRETPPPTSPNLEDGARIASPEKPSSSFKPGIAVVVCVLSTMFSLTFLLLIYVKHCNGGNIESGGGNITGGGNSTSRAVPPLSGRKNSGIDRCIVESLPVFRFGSLRGQKEGLDCAVCLMKFEGAEVLRLLPKCKHAFHVECVDTWLDAHSTCPLCRYRVDPEDILLIEEAKVFRQNERNSNEQEWLRLDLEKGKEIAESLRRHSSVGERETEEQSRSWTASFRRSLDGATWRKKSESVVSVGCFVRPRKDGMLLTREAEERDRRSVERRLEHRIIVSPAGPGGGPLGGPGGESGVHERWSDVQASELLYLTSEMIMSTRRGGRKKKGRSNNDDDEDSCSGRGIINSRSVSEITGLSRFSFSSTRDRENQEEGMVKRWLAWISKSRTQPAVR
ncbi:hypothetical protein VNO77_11095 [Canavalia gladiata]|uniref:RING-type E3 ubiquitin transferase n=1 Tax=Canavalia gladiata TaxID=3824 RepID=A0AAN9MCH5_CANGL